VQVASLSKHRERSSSKKIPAHCPPELAVPKLSLLNWRNEELSTNTGPRRAKFFLKFVFSWMNACPFARLLKTDSFTGHVIKR